MKKIGIKLADGSFYPLLEEGIPDKKEINLTTVQDNQTTVKVDLFRSEDGTLDDAEYVDTLKITRLKKRPNGVPDIGLDIWIDEEGRLGAALNDSDSGAEAHTSVTLLSTILQGKNVQPEPAGKGLLNAAEAALNREESEKVHKIADQLDEFVLDMPDFDSFSNAAEVTEPENTGIRVKSARKSAPAKKAEAETKEAVIPEPEPVEETVIEAEPEPEALPETSLDIEPLPEIEDIPVGPEPVPAVEETAVLDEPLPDIDDVPVDEEPLPDFDMDMPDFPETSFGDTKFESKDDEPLDFGSTDSLDFDMPDFSDGGFDDSTAKTSGTIGTTNSASSELDFSDLYDDVDGGAGDDDDDDDDQKKTRLPMLICLICAGICILAVLLLLFIFPSKFNLNKKNKSESVVITEKISEPAPKPAVQEELPPPPPPKKEEPKAELIPPSEVLPLMAKEDEIVVVRESEKVVPDLPPVPEKKQVKEIAYRLRWGDTLWDLADAYYNNPWRYPRIAEYNGIKNPDRIVAGTLIKIPED